MFLIKANIVLDNRYRKEPIRGNTYRPLFYFSNKLVRSGLLILSQDEVLEMDKEYENRLVKIYFYKDIDPFKEFLGRQKFHCDRRWNRNNRRGIITNVIGENVSELENSE